MHSFILGVALFIISADVGFGATASLSPDGGFGLNAPPSLNKVHLSRVLTDFEKQFYKLTGYPPSAELPILVVLHDSETDDFPHPHLRMDAMEGNVPRIQIDLRQESRLSPESSRLLAQGLLLREYYSGKTPPPGSDIAEFPSWLLHGLGRLCNPEAKPVMIPSSYLQGGLPPSVEDLLIQKAPEDSHQSLLGIYDAMSSTLLNAGMKSTNGNSIFREWIGHFNMGSPKKITSNWPADWPMQLVERRWLLLMAGMAGTQSGVTSILGVDETISLYDAILKEAMAPNNSMALLKKQKGADFLFQELSNKLIALRLEGNPLTLPLLDQTIQLCGKIKHFSVKKIAEKEKTLALLRDQTLTRSHAIDSYLDWYEAAKLPVRSGLFDNLLNTPDTTVKKGPIGEALDAVEERGW